jgi:hypothetical protein
VELLQLRLLFGAKFRMIDAWIQMILPTLATHSMGSGWNVMSHTAPLYLARAAEERDVFF